MMRRTTRFVIVSRLLAYVVAAGVLGALGTPTTAQASATFEFAGECGDCTGTATATIVLDNYNPANPSSATLVSFTYTSNLVRFSITPPNYDLSGSLPFSAIPAAANLDIDTYDPIANFGIGFVSLNDAMGDWSVDTFSHAPDYSYKPGGNQLSVNKDYGVDGVWELVSVPEPGTLALMFLGLAVVLAAQRPRRAA